MALNPLVGCALVQVVLTRAQLVSTILDLQYSSALLRSALSPLSPTRIALPRESVRSLWGSILAPGLERQSVTALHLIWFFEVNCRVLGQIRDPKTHGHGH